MDPHLRELERRWQQSGDTVNLQAFLVALRRVGDRETYFEVASDAEIDACGNPIAFLCGPCLTVYCDQCIVLCVNTRPHDTAHGRIICECSKGFNCDRCKHGPYCDACWTWAPRCEICHNITDSRGRVACDCNLIFCNSCGSQICNDCLVGSYSPYGNNACKKCAETCSACGKKAKHIENCNECGASLCLECDFGCVKCHKTLCSSDAIECLMCSNLFCDDCQSYCQECTESPLCPRCVRGHCDNKGGTRIIFGT